MLTCQIDKRLGSFRLRVSLAVQDHVVGLFGPSGSGKSLTLQCIAGLMAPDSGRITVGGVPVFDSAAGINLPPQKRHVGYVFQNYALFPHLSVADNIAYGLHGISAAERADRVSQALRLIRLQGLERRLPGHLSGGQQQRVALARALVTRPSVLLLDEPFAALDSMIRSELLRQLLDLLHELPIPTLFVTHHLDDAYALSREIAVYDNGSIAQAGPRDEVYHRPSSPEVARYVGITNVLPGRVEAASGWQTRVSGPGFPIWAPPSSFAPGQEVLCCIRPEYVVPVGEHDRREPNETWLTGEVTDEVAYGSHVNLRFRPDAGEAPDLQITLPAYMSRSLGIRPQKRCTFALNAEYIHLIAAGEGRSDR